MLPQLTTRNFSDLKKALKKQGSRLAERLIKSDELP